MHICEARGVVGFWAVLSLARLESLPRVELANALDLTALQQEYLQRK
jgi:hypothetical protein